MLLWRVTGCVMTSASVVSVMLFVCVVREGFFLTAACFIIVMLFVFCLQDKVLAQKQRGKRVLEPKEKDVCPYCDEEFSITGMNLHVSHRHKAKHDEFKKVSTAAVSLYQLSSQIAGTFPN